MFWVVGFFCVGESRGKTSGGRARRKKKTTTAERKRARRETKKHNNKLTGREVDQDGLGRGLAVLHGDQRVLGHFRDRHLLPVLGVLDVRDDDDGARDVARLAVDGDLLGQQLGEAFRFGFDVFVWLVFVWWFCFDCVACGGGCLLCWVSMERLKQGLERSPQNAEKNSDGRDTNEKRRSPGREKKTPFSLSFAFARLTVRAVDDDRVGLGLLLQGRDALDLDAVLVVRLGQVEEDAHRGDAVVHVGQGKVAVGRGVEHGRDKVGRLFGVFCVCFLRDCCERVCELGSGR